MKLFKLEEWNEEQRLSIGMNTQTGVNNLHLENVILRHIGCECDGYRYLGLLVDHLVGNHLVLYALGPLVLLLGQYEVNITLLLIVLYSIIE